MGIRFEAWPYLTFPTVSHFVLLIAAEFTPSLRNGVVEEVDTGCALGVAVTAAEGTPSSCVAIGNVGDEIVFEIEVAKGTQVASRVFSRCGWGAQV